MGKLWCFIWVTSLDGADLVGLSPSVGVATPDDGEDGYCSFIK